MGLRERVAKALLPPGTVIQTEAQIAAASVPQSGMLATPLERDPELASLPFPPAAPLFPALINTPRSEGRADPRRWEFPVAWNLQITEQRTVPFSVLRQVADNADIVRKCIEVVKAALMGQEWDISITPDAVSHVMSEQSISHLKASQLLRDDMRPEIARVKDFWKYPDRLNGMSFHEWLGQLLEESMVIDALSIYPNTSYDAKLHSLEILDGATIKPLLDGRGSRPVAPHPAYQQILWGYPRGEFTATPDADGEFTSDDLIYAPRTRRPFTPYGFGPVERCLPLVDLYMKRLQWFRTEFTDGVMPDLMMKTDMDFGNNPQLLQGYEQVFNDALAGNMEARRRMRILPDGFDPVFPRTADAKYSSLFDEFLVKSICGHFGVLPTQIGFTPQSGLGGSGHQKGEQDSAETLGLRPTITWVIDLLNMLSQRFLKMSHQLTFVFADGTEQDQRAMADRRQVELFTGQKTWNEVRTEMGLPLFEFPEADVPIVVAGRTILPLQATFESVSINPDDTEGEPIDPQRAKPAPGAGTPNLVPASNPPLPPQNPNQPEPTKPGRVPPSKPVPEPVKAELAQFTKWAKSERQRPFEFVHLVADDADRLNALVAVDAEAARELAGVLRKGVGHPKVLAGPELVKVRRNVLDQALTQVENMVEVSPGKVAVPWEQQPRPKIPTANWAESMLHGFHIQDLVATQPYLDKKTVVYHLNHLAKAAEADHAIPNVVLSDGFKKIYDGHHRLAAMWLLGAEMVNCWTLEV